MQQYIEENCTITLDGHTFKAAGAYITDTHATVHLANETLPTPWIHPSGRESWYARKTGTEHWRGTLTNWNGDKVGTYTIRSHWGQGYTDMYAIVATINGCTYHGRTQGPGMVAHLKAHK